MAFGLSPTAQPFGFHAVDGLRPSSLVIKAVNSCMVAPVANDTDILGGMFTLSGLPFACRSHEVDATDALRRKATVMEFDTRRAALVYRPREMTIIRADESALLRIRFDWTGPFQTVRERQP